MTPVKPLQEVHSVAVPLSLLRLLSLRNFRDHSPTPTSSPVNTRFVSLCGTDMTAHTLIPSVDGDAGGI